ncbi:hypothetical protein [Pseudobacteroides cellulosolvens]|uniref:hypothetical protein n=1 Tax=Pseudobacteroides cellulosolvens TaxID=35825 RepID=UPI001FA73A84|nr:hypothetical protein [Pseudobacteroides cellulosolvens]
MLFLIYFGKQCIYTDHSAILKEELNIMKKKKIRRKKYQSRYRRLGKDMKMQIL